MLFFQIFQRPYNLISILVEWGNVYLQGREGAKMEGPFTFQAILHDNGDIGIVSHLRSSVDSSCTMAGVNKATGRAGMALFSLSKFLLSNIFL